MSGVREAYDALAPDKRARLHGATAEALEGRSEPERRELAAALGGNAQVILDVIPGFEQLLGKQPPVVALGRLRTEIDYLG